MFRCSLSTKNQTPPIVPITWCPRSCFCDCCGANACVIAFVVGGSLCLAWIPDWFPDCHVPMVLPVSVLLILVVFIHHPPCCFFPGKLHLLMKLQQRAAIEVIHAHSLLPMQRMDQTCHKNFITSQVQSTNSWKQKLLRSIGPILTPHKKPNDSKRLGTT